MRSDRDYGAAGALNTRESFDERGNVRPVTEWTREMGYAVAGIEVVIKNAEGATG